MAFHERYTLPSGNQREVDLTWFDQQKQLLDPLRDSLVDEAVDALKLFHDGLTTAVEATVAITRPISNSPTLYSGRSLDDSLALNDLWGLLISALFEWPSIRTPELLDLLDAIGKIPDEIHRGDMTKTRGWSHTWHGFPYIGMQWPDDMEPGEICKECPDEASRALARRLYLRTWELEALLVARGVIGLSRRATVHISRTLETDLVECNGRLTPVAPIRAPADLQIILDFHVPAIVFMLKVNVEEVYNYTVRKDEQRGRRLPEASKPFKDGAERWLFWKRRLGELAEGNVDEEVKIAAQVALTSMDSIAMPT